VISFTPQWFYS